MTRIFRSKFYICFLLIHVLVGFSYIANAANESLALANKKMQGLKSDAGNSTSSNPAAVNITPGTGEAQKYIQSLLCIKDNYGINFNGAWLGDGNYLFSGGIPHATRLSGNSLFLLSLTVDTKKSIGWPPGGLFGVQFLQFNGGNTNGQAGTVQGYNSLPGLPPLSRSELYQLWYRQALFDEKVIIRIGKVVPTFDFNNVIKPVPLNQSNVMIPAVTGLIYTPIFVNTTMLGVLPGYYNSAYGLTLNFILRKNWYLSYGVYDGNLARGVQTGLTGPHFNGSYFHIAETGFTWLIGENELPGTFAFGGWDQTGLIIGSPTLTEHGASGYYLFGSQRLWYRHPGVDNSGISVFYQYGANNSNALPMVQYLGLGLTAFGLVPCRPDDSMGIGSALSWLNRKSFNQKTEWILQSYYQAQLMKGIYFEPVLSYISRPAANPNHHAAFAGTARLIILF